MKALFLTFGDGSADFRAAAARLAEQAKSIGVFSSVVNLNHQSLLQVSQHYAFAEPSIVNLDIYPTYFRASKAWVIQAGLLGKFGEFDLVCYADAGCEINSNSITRFSLKKNMQRAFLLGGLAEQTVYPEKYWTKKRTIEYFNTSETHQLSGQLASTLCYLRVNSVSIELVNKWCTLSDYKLDLWQDPKNRDKEVENFKEHRHDQSIFSLLWKQAGLPVTPTTSQWGIRLPNLRGACIPIQTMRNRTGKSRLTKLSRSNIAAILGVVINLLSEAKRKAFHGI
jgi:hypothetical protein